MGFKITAGGVSLYETFGIEEVGAFWAAFQSQDLTAVGLEKLDCRDLTGIDLAGLQIVFLLLREYPKVRLLPPRDKKAAFLIEAIGIRVEAEAHED